MKIHSYVGSRMPSIRWGGPQVAKVLGSTVRFNILKLLFDARTARRELCVNEIAKAIRMSQSATSHQLALLEAYGIVEGERRGKTMCYSLTDSRHANDIGKVIRVFHTYES